MLGVVFCFILREICAEKNEGRGESRRGYLYR
jgi:hypothetical protein